MKKIYFIIAIFFINISNGQVGINTVLPLSTLDINGNLSVKTVSLVGSSSVTLINNGVYISVNPTAIDQEFKLPNPISFPGRVYFIRNISSSTAKITMEGTGVKFYFANSYANSSNQLYMYDSQNSNDHANGNGLRSCIVLSDGANWNVFTP